MSSKNSAEPLLYDDGLNKEELQEACFHSRRSRGSWAKKNALSLIILALLVYIAIVQTIESAHLGGPAPLSNECPWVDNHDKLPKDIMQYEEKQEWYEPEYPWNLEPSDELDDRWEDLLYAQNIRVSPEEVHRLNKNTTNRIQLDHGDYLGVIGVYHHLHCLNNLRRLVHWDYYESKLNYTGSNGHGPWDKEHSDHCIDSIRQALMCHANTELHTGIWVHDPERPQAARIDSHSLTTCVKWDALDKWARSRALVDGEYSYRPVSYEESVE